MFHHLKFFYEYLLMALGLLYWAVAGLSVTIAGIIFYTLLPQKYSRPCGRFILQKAFLIFIYYLKITRLLYLDDGALTVLKDYQGGAIIAPNHIALWDAVFIIAKIPETVCIMKGAILRNPFLGGGARLAGYIANDSSSQMLKAASKQLEQGEKLLLFPEGTRTKHEAQWLNPFQGAVAVIAKRTGVPVIPVYIRSNSRFFEKEWPLYKKPEFPLHISFELGEAVYFSKEDDVHSFTDKLQQHYLNVLSKPHPLRRKQHTGL